MFTLFKRRMLSKSVENERLMAMTELGLCEFELLPGEALKKMDHVLLGFFCHYLGCSDCSHQEIIRLLQNKRIDEDIKKEICDILLEVLRFRYQLCAPPDRTQMQELLLRCRNVLAKL